MVHADVEIEAATVKYLQVRTTYGYYGRMQSSRAVIRGAICLIRYFDVTLAQVQYCLHARYRHINGPAQIL